MKLTPPTLTSLHKVFYVSVEWGGGAMLPWILIRQKDRYHCAVTLVYPREG